MTGRAKVVWDDGSGELVETELEPGLGYSCQIGQRHRLVGITDCDILEVSTPEIGTTHRLEDDYARPDETEAVRSSPGRGLVGAVAHVGGWLVGADQPRASLVHLVGPRRGCHPVFRADSI